MSANKSSNHQGEQAGDRDGSFHDNDAEVPSTREGAREQHVDDASKTANDNDDEDKGAQHQEGAREQHVDDASKTANDNDDEDKGAYNFEGMSGAQMIIRQLSICRMKKNVDPSWKQKAKETVSPFILLLYVASSFSFTAAGIILVIEADRLDDALKSDWYPWMVFGVYLILQGFVTAMSDVVYVDRPSIWHPLDRAFAMLGSIFTLSSIITLLADSRFRPDHIGGICAVLAGTVLSAIMFMTEWQYKAKGDIQMFVVCHTGWHVFGPLGFIALFLSLSKLGESFLFECESDGPFLGH
eukprot:CAMPEP_0172475378 /NCGR_PEP_ID=MMETSP1065-20121228/69838_1 /TAXON_ID=265537 /ORGANISM="Amphiprora paludosa, Strain CCMP125" /LENGTH=297 /DNA_ID=CAMNT_0013233579 /DNA_START=204 /DNA_END=1098 /DNA_ORIENTATION=-